MKIKDIYMLTALLLFSCNLAAKENAEKQEIWTPICVGGISFKYKEVKYKYDFMGYFPTNELIQQFDDQRMPVACRKSDDLHSIGVLNFDYVCIEKMHYFQITQSAGKGDHTTNYPLFTPCK